jgi:hypothetical protein
VSMRTDSELVNNKTYSMMLDVRVYVESAAFKIGIPCRSYLRSARCHCLLDFSPLAAGPLNVALNLGQDRFLLFTSKCRAFGHVDVR